MQVKGSDNFYNRVTNAFTLPINTRCAELTVLLERASVIELQNIFPYLIDNIFGPQGGATGWGLRTTPECIGEDFKQLRHFLSPCGPLFSCIYALLKDTTAKYDFPLSYLPLKVRNILESESNHPFYTDLILISPQSKHITLNLNPFDYYMFHFAYYLINPWHQKSPANVNYSWNTVYYILCCDYILHFLPTDPKTPILPTINYNGKNPFQIMPQIHRPHYVPSLISPSLWNKPPEDYTFHQNLDKHPRNEIWRSETVLTVFIDLWLNNDQVNQQPNQNLNSSFNNPQAMPRFHFNELPSGEYMRIVRVFIKQIHAFATSAKADDTHLGELKKITLPMVQGKFYVFIRNLLHRWPLDGSFRLVLELWLTYIQPWRYPPDNLNKHLNLKPINPDVEDIALMQNTPVEREWLPFIVDNLLAYIVIFQQLLPRFTRVDLISPKMAIMLYRITKVFNQPNLADLLKEVECCVENNSSPSHGYNTQWSNILPPLIHTSMWSTNTLTPNTGFECNTKQLFTPDATNTSVLCSSYIHGDKKWACILRQKIYELEGPNFCYKPLFTKPPAQEVYDVSHHISRSIVAAQDIICIKQQEEAKQYAGIWGFFKSIFDTNYSNDEFTLAERKKVTSYLEFSLQNLVEMFEIGELKEQEKSYVNNSFKASDDLSFLTPSKVRERRNRIKYEGDPDLKPIMTTENAFLVRLLYHLSVSLNEQFGLHFQRLYYENSFKGRLARQMLCEPVTVFKYDKSREGSPRVPKRLPPRVSFRPLASYKFIIYFLVGLILSEISGFGILLYTIVLLCIFLLYKFIKSIPPTEERLTENFCNNIVFNDSF